MVDGDLTDMDATKDEALDRALMQAQGRKLIRVAVSAVLAGLRTGTPPKIMMKSVPEPLRVPRATFVTLTRGGKLRGCIGSMAPQRPLVLDVAYNAYSAAFRDPRFPPLEPAEAKNLGLSIALLSAPRILPVASHGELLAALEPGRTGLIISDPGEGAAARCFCPRSGRICPTRRSS
jgi:AmmeMemoRadiSam system protein A